MKVRLAACMLLLLFLSAMAVSAADEDSQPKIALTPEHLEAEIGQEVRVNVFGEQLQDLYGYEIRLTYDAQRLQFKEAIPAWDGFQVPPIVKDGAITAAHTKVGKVSGEDGNGKIMTFVFEAVEAGDAKIKLENVILVNSKVESAAIKPELLAAVSVPFPEDIGFTDISGHWAEEAIRRATALGLVNGYPDGTFRPDQQITRGEYAAMLVRALKKETSHSPEPAFADSKDIPEWVKPYVASASSAGWLKGYPDNTVRADDKIARAEMTVMTVRAAGISSSREQPDAAMFADHELIPAWAASEAAAAYRTGLVTGKPDARFDPFAYTTRAEAVSVILRMLDMVQ